MKNSTGVFVIFILLALDQMSKLAVEHYLPLRQSVDLLPVLALYRTHNTGIAFSLFAGVGDLPLILLTLAITGFVVFLWTRSGSDRFFLRAGYALIIGGAIGNLIDRVRLGHVVDFILFHVGNWSFAVFNLADSFITVGAMLVVLGEFLEHKQEPKA